MNPTRMPVAVLAAMLVGAVIRSRAQEQQQDQYPDQWHWSLGYIRRKVNLEK
jgi:hypothetical protein